MFSEYLLRLNIWGRLEKGKKRLDYGLSICWEWTFGEDRKRVRKDWITDLSICWVNIWGRQEKCEKRLDYWLMYQWTFEEDRKRVRKDLITDSVCWEWTFREDRKSARKDWITDSKYLLRVNIWEGQGKGWEKTGLLTVSICWVNIWGRQEKDKSRLDYRPLKMQETDTLHRFISQSRRTGMENGSTFWDNAWSIIHGYIANRNSNGIDWLKHINLIVEAILSLVCWK